MSAHWVGGSDVAYFDVRITRRRKSHMNRTYLRRKSDLYKHLKMFSISRFIPKPHTIAHDRTFRILCEGP